MLVDRVAGTDHSIGAEISENNRLSGCRVDPNGVFQSAEIGVANAVSVCAAIQIHRLSSNVVGDGNHRANRKPRTVDSGLQFIGGERSHKRCGLNDIVVKLIDEKPANSDEARCPNRNTRHTR